MSTRRQGGGWLVVLSAFAIMVVIALPLLLTGGLAVQIQRDIVLRPSTLGMASMSYFLAAAVLSVFAGRMAERIGTAPSLRLAGFMSALSMVGVTLASEPWHLLALLALAGVSLSLSQPAASAAIVEHVTIGRRGLAFGLQQSAIPSAGLLAGLAVPALGATIGWRWAYVAGALLGIITAWTLPGIRSNVPPTAVVETQGRVAGFRSSYGWLVVLAAAAALASSIGNALGIFVTSSSVATGLTVTQAGLLLAVGSCSAIIGRTGAGLLAEQSRRGALPVTIALLLVGATGFALMASGVPAVFTMGAMLAFAGGWTWQGAFLFAIVRRWPDAPAAVTGTVQTGNYLGGVAGPAIFGLIAERGTFASAWMVAALVAVGAATLFEVGRRGVLSQLPR